MAQALEAFGRIRFDKPLVDAQSFSEGLKQVKQKIRETWSSAAVVERCSELLNHANETSFRNRLLQTCALVPEEFFRRQFGEKEEFAGSVVQTRNYFTHLGIRPGALVVKEGKEMFLLNQKLHALLRCVMLIDLGVPFEYLAEPIGYQCKKWA